MNIQQCLHRLSNSVSTLTCLESEGGETTETYAQLYERALALLGALQRGPAGARPGDGGGARRASVPSRQSSGGSRRIANGSNPKPRGRTCTVTPESAMMSWSPASAAFE